MKRTVMMLLTAFMALALVACGGKEEVFAPEEINEGTDRCDVCNMLVPNDHNAAQLVLNDGQALKFDDIGDLAVWVDENGLDDVNVRYVRDYGTEEWIQIEDATFVYDKDFRTPMAYGVYSFKSKDDAETFIEEEGTGELLSYTDLEQHNWERNMELMEKMKEEHGHDHDHGNGDDHDGHDEEETEHDHEE